MKRFVKYIHEPGIILMFSFLIIIFSCRKSENEQPRGYVLKNFGAPENWSDTDVVNFFKDKAHHYLFTYPDSLSFFAEKTLLAASLSGIREEYGPALSLLGIAEYFRGNYRQALKYYLQALHFFVIDGNSNKTTRTLNNIGLILVEIYDLKEAEKYFRLAIRGFKKDGDESGLYRAYLNMMVCYSRDTTAPIDSGIHYAHLTLKGGLSINDSILISKALANISSFYGRKLMLDSAKSYLNQLESFHTFGQDVLNDLLVYQLRANVLDAESLYAQCIPIALEALEISEAIKANPETIRIYQSLYRYYYFVGEYEKSKDAFRKYCAYRDTFNIQSRRDAMRELEEAFLLNSEAHYIREQSRIEEQIRNLNLQLLGGGTFLLFCFALLIRRGIRLEKQRSLLVAAKNKELLHIQKELKIQQERLQELNQSKDHIFTIISRDLRNPVSSLHNLLETCLLNQLTPEKFQKLIPNFTRNINYTSGLLENVLHWAGAQLRDISPELRPLPSESWAAGSKTALDLMAGEKNIRIVWDIPEQTSALLDARMLDILIRNLGSNAIIFSPPGSEIRIGMQVSEGYFVLEVCDEGSGLKPEQLAMAAKGIPASTPGTAGEQGSGLGLILCHDLAARLNGTISVSARLSRGSCVSIKWKTR